MISTPARTGHAVTSLWRNVNFLLMWSSVAASGFGDRILQLAAWEMCGIGLPHVEPARVTASVTFYFMLPYVLFGPFGGWIADTLPRKWVMLACDETRAIIMLAALLLAQAPMGSGSPHGWIYVLVFGTGTMAAIFSPTRAALMPQIVPARLLQSANALVLGMAVIAAMIGLGVGDWIIERQSLRAAMGHALGAFAISGLFFAFLKARPPGAMRVGSTPQIQRFVQAVGYIRNHRPVLLLLVQSVAFWGAAHLFINAIGVVALRRYETPTSELRTQIAIMQMVIGLGMFTSALGVAWFNTRRESTWLALGSLLASGVLMLLLAVNRSHACGMVLAFCAGMTGNTAMICVATLTQSITPNHIRGRVFGVRDLAVTITAVIVNFAIWQIHGSNDWLIGALTIFAAVLVLGAGIGIWFELTGGPTSRRSANVAWRLARVYVLFWHRLQWVGRHRVPRTGPVILASNHTTGVDPVLIQAAVPRVVRWVMLKRFRKPCFNLFWKIMDPIAIEEGHPNIAPFRRIVTAAKEGHIVGIFPEGGLQREHRQLNAVRPGVGLVARRSGAVIVPVWIDGTPLAHGMLWHFLCPSRSTVHFGHPYRPDPDWDEEQFAGDLRRRLLALADTAEARPA